MKKLSVLLIALFVVVGVAFAQKSPKVNAESKNVKISYGQPSKRDRAIFGALVPYNQVWRAGANEATEITFAKDATLGGKAVKAGTYSLFVIPTEKEWTIILNSELKQWGSYGYDKIKDKNVAEVKAAVKTLGSVVEALTYTTDDKNITISWDKTSVSVPVSFK